MINFITHSTNNLLKSYSVKLVTAPLCASQESGKIWWGQILTTSGIEMLVSTLSPENCTLTLVSTVRQAGIWCQGWQKCSCRNYFLCVFHLSFLEIKNKASLIAFNFTDFLSIYSHKEYKVGRKNKGFESGILVFKFSFFHWSLATRPEADYSLSEPHCPQHFFALSRGLLEIEIDKTVPAPKKFKI